jgi:hypothetical protein
MVFQQLLVKTMPNLLEVSITSPISHDIYELIVVQGLESV